MKPWKLNILNTLLVLFYLTIINGFPVFGQHLSKTIHEIDSLYKAAKYKEAAKLLNSFQAAFLAKNPSKSLISQEILLRKGMIEERINDHERALRILLSINPEIDSKNLLKINFRANLVIALIYEKEGNFNLCKRYLNNALELYSRKKEPSWYSTYCVRLSSFYRVSGKIDSALIYSYSALRYAQRFHNEPELADAHLLTGYLLAKSKSKEALLHLHSASRLYLRLGDFESAAAIYNSISGIYSSQNDFRKAFLYNDTSFLLLGKVEDGYILRALESRSNLYESVGNLDSALHLRKIYHQKTIEFLKKQKTTEVQKITEEYEVDKKVSIIHTKNIWLITAFAFILVVSVGSFFLYRQSKRINSQNKLIQKQVKELERLLEQKQILLTELQHRVKNNLQQVISILDLQKEAINHNNLGEVIRQNQNRIYSMSLIHNKLSISSDEVNLYEYLKDLTDLVISSYQHSLLNVDVEIKSKLANMLFETAISLGLIIVELLSNSMKHAFVGKTSGRIIISAKYDAELKTNILTYSDDGIGFNFQSPPNKGLGIEIVEGLVAQINGRIGIENSKGFNLTIFF